LRGVFRGSARQYVGQGKNAAAGWLYLDPALVSATRLFEEVNRDTGELRRFVRETSHLVGDIAEKRTDLAGLVDNLATTTTAIGSEQAALAESIETLPPFMRRANTTFLNLRAALDDLDPLVEESKPVAKKLRPFMAELRPLAQDARPTFADLAEILRRPGADNDLLELTRLQPSLRDATVREVEANGDERQAAFPAITRALKDAAPIVSSVRPYAPDALGWFDDFSHSGIYDALGAASRVGIYDFLGYYDICYIGDEVKDPGRVIPRSILISIVAVALIYIAINLSIIGVVPWRDFVPADAHPESEFIVSSFMERLYGPNVATVFTFLILWTAFGSVFALLLGYSRIPFAAARDGYFFSVFGRLHPTKQFPHVSLVVLGVIAAICALLPLGFVIDALITTRIIVQFMGQVFAVMLLRARRPDMPRPFRMWLYPLPAFVALAGWIFLLLTSGWRLIALGVGTLLLGVVCFLVWSWRLRSWPFGTAAEQRAL
jgi:hypothetical protein